MNTGVESLPEHDGTLPAHLPAPGEIIESESAFWAAVQYDMEAPLLTEREVATRVVGFCKVMKPLINWFPIMVSAAKCCLDQVVRIKRLEATMRVIQGLVTDRTAVMVATDDARFRFIQAEVGAALLGSTKTHNLVIVIGKKAYLNITLAEAQSRYLRTTGIEPLPSMIRTMLFIDEFTEELPDAV